MSLEKAKEHLAKFGRADAVMEFDTSSATVELAAAAVGCESARIAKTLSFAVGDRVGLATLYGTLSRGIEIHEKGSSGMADPRRPRKFSEEFKRQIVQLYDNGKPVSEIGAEYDLSHSTVHRWIKSIHGSGSTRAADNRTPEQQRILELEKENKQLRMEVDVLKTAALIFARK